MNNFYIYFYLRDDFTPYYVGKGKNNRAWNTHRYVGVPKDKSHIIIIQDNLSEVQSFILERYFIRWFGRKDNNTGILRNMTDGGEGTSGYKHSIISIEKSKIKRTGLKRSQNFCENVSNRQKGKTQTELTKEKRANSHRGQKRSDKAKLNMRLSQNNPEVKMKNSLSNKIAQNRPEVKDKKSKTYIISKPSGELVVIKNLKEFCILNNLNQGNMWSVCHNKYCKDNYKGYKIKEHE